MTTARPLSKPPSLAGAEWLAAAAVRRLFREFAASGVEIRAVGGAVRDALLGRAVNDIDFAVSAPPEVVERVGVAAGFKVVPTGRGHGTLTLVVDGRPFEVTSLREDVATDGRHAVVRFGTDWVADAERRDFTINSLSVNGDGEVYDPLDAYADVVARRVRFIGDADRRIAEDRLRALRFFRFHAQIGEGTPDAEGLAATIRARHDLATLSAERVGQEVRKIVLAPRAAATIEIMQDAGILPLVFAGVSYLPAFSRLSVDIASKDVQSGFTVRLAALACRIEEDVRRLTDRLRLANAERDEMSAALAFARDLPLRPGPEALKLRLYRAGERIFRDGLLLAWSWRYPSATEGHDADWLERLSLPKRWSPPTFPLNGRDIVASGVVSGPRVGEMLRQLEDLWIQRDFSPTAADLRQELRRLAAPP